MFCKITVTYTSKSKVEVKLEYKLKIQTLFLHWVFLSLKSW